MASAYTTALKEWFYKPNLLTTPEHDRMYCFKAAVSRIGAAILDGRMSKEDLRLTHDLLTYLLLGRHPLTDTENESEYEQSEHIHLATLVRWGEVRDTIVKLMDFTTKKPHGNFYPLLVGLMKELKPDYPRYTSNYAGEMITLQYLALWLLDRKVRRPEKDLGLIRACLELSCRADNMAPGEIDHEYAFISNDLKYCEWFTQQVNRLLELQVDVQTLKSSMAYMGYFISLIRATRMKFEENDAAELPNYLQFEVDALKDTLHNADLRYEECRVKEGAGKLASMMRLFTTFRIKPPPVKILPVKK